MPRQPLGGNRRPGMTKKSATKKSPSVGTGTRRAPTSSGRQRPQRPGTAPTGRQRPAAGARARPGARAGARGAGAGRMGAERGATMRRRPPKKDNTVMIIVLCVAGVLILGVVGYLSLREPPKKIRVGKDNFSKAKMKVDKMYSDLNDRYAAFNSKISGVSSYTESHLSEARSIKKEYNNLIDVITKFKEQDAKNAKEKKVADDWYKDAQQRRRALTSFVSKYS